MNTVNKSKRFLFGIFTVAAGMLYINLAHADYPAVCVFNAAGVRMDVKVGNYITGNCDSSDEHVCDLNLGDTAVIPQGAGQKICISYLNWKLEWDKWKCVELPNPKHHSQNTYVVRGTAFGVHGEYADRACGN